MALAYDDSKAPLGPIEREDLVQAVINAPASESEPEWIEWKIPRDPLSIWIPRIAWYVGGFGNRPVGWAQRFVEGFGYLLLGAEPGSAVGVTPIDTADLVKGVASWLGASGPRIDPHFIEVNGVSVLLVGVAPPRDGEPVHLIRKNFGGLIDGANFPMRDGDVPIRVGSETRKANSYEHDLLVARAGGGKPKLDITVVDASRRLQAIDASDEVRDAWLDSVRGELLKSVPSPNPPSLSGLGEGAMDMMQTMFGEARTPEKYRQLVMDYIDEARDSWLKRLVRLAARHHLAELYIDVRNNTEDNFSDVELTLKVTGAVAAAWAVEWDDLTLPKPPKPYGSQRITASLDDIVMPHYLNMPTPLTTVNSSAEIRREGDTTTIKFDSFDLRPGATEELETVVLLIGARHAGKDLVASWRANSKSVSGSIPGELRLKVDDAVTSPIDVMDRPEPEVTYGERTSIDDEETEAS